MASSTGTQALPCSGHVLKCLRVLNLFCTNKKLMTIFLSYRHTITKLLEPLFGIMYMVSTPFIVLCSYQPFQVTSCIYSIVITEHLYRLLIFGTRLDGGAVRRAPSRGAWEECTPRIIPRFRIIQGSRRPIWWLICFSMRIFLPRGRLPFTRWPTSRLRSSWRLTPCRYASWWLQMLRQTHLTTIHFNSLSQKGVFDKEQRTNGEKSRKKRKLTGRMCFLRHVFLYYFGA